MCEYEYLYLCEQERNVPLSSCQPVELGGLVEYALCLVHSYNHQVQKDNFHWDGLDEVRNGYATQWSSSEVEIFCEGVRRHGDHIRRVWQLLEDTKSLREVLDFYLRLYPYAQRSGIEKFLMIFKRAERASQGEVKKVYPSSLSPSHLILFSFELLCFLICSLLCSTL